uniref:Uncharacterized protein n=1 Tax=viral metagenome TaxID=1070528 RepID=A0A6C0BST5_9ZZZZ
MSSNEDLPYSATSLSIVARILFMYLLYKNKSTNTLSLIFCLLNICSSSIWICYSTNNNDLPMIIRSSSELFLITLSAAYIIKNKINLLKHSSDKQLPIFKIEIEPNNN